MEDIINFFLAMGMALYIRTFHRNVDVHGIFTDEEQLRIALSHMNDFKGLYFNAQELSNNIQGIPVNSFGSIKKGKGLKREHIDNVWYLCIDIDPIYATENHSVNVSAKKNLMIVEVGKSIAQDLIDNGFATVQVNNSGNGCQLIIPIESIDADYAKSLMKNFATTIADLYKGKTFSVDISVARPEGMLKLPGSVSPKGTGTEKNPLRSASEVVKADFSVVTVIDTVEKFIKDNAPYLKYIGYTSKGVKYIKQDLLLEDLIETLDPYRYLGNVYITIDVNNSKRDEIITSDIATSYIRNLIRKMTNSILINKKYYEEVIATVVDSSDYKDVQLYHRVKFDADANCVLYDIGDNKKAVEITAGGVSLVEKPKRTFRSNINDKPQKLPNLKTPATDVIPLMGKYINLPDEYDLLLFCVIVACALMGNTSFQHCILVLIGVMASGKTTSSKYLSNIVSPCLEVLLDLPDKESDLKVILSNRMLVVFDNLSGIKAKVADTFCRCVTGAYASKRKLYYDSSEVIMPMNSIICLNGLELLTNRTDMLDRACLIEFKHIDNSEGLSSHDLDVSFQKDLPKILGGFFNAISLALADKNNYETEDVIRLHDFQRYGEKIAVALGYSAEMFDEALVMSNKRITNNIVETNILIQLICSLMTYRKVLEKVPTGELHKKLLELAEVGTIPITSTNFPDDTTKLGLALLKYESQLKDFGITFVREREAHQRGYSFYNDGSVVPNALPQVNENSSKKKTSLRNRK